MNRAKDIFSDAIGVAGDERVALLDRECAGDSALRGEVEDLIRAYETAGAFLGEPTAAPPPMTEHDPLRLDTGHRIGPYEIERLLGEGGFGSVYLAKQTEPVVRDVALKLIKPGMDTRQVIRRFEAERQALAVMDHPAIARVYDAGTTPDGRPFFAMEYVPGEPITSYADRNHLSIPDRLRLFVRVCNAVQHAHTKGVIHRDIKPSNVLVTEINGQPEPRVIDFGLAKAVTGSSPGETVLTHTAQIMGTPHYMAPEQAALDHGDVDTRADVYSLGVLLYELLTGQTPFESKAFKGAALSDLEKMIREVVPPRPSSRIADLGDLGDPFAQARKLDTHHLWRTLKGDLDWVVMKALEKSRSRRYATAYALGSDVERFMRREPVEAGPPSRAYRFSKFVQRNRLQLSAAAVVVLAIAALAVGGVWFGLRERAARSLASKELAMNNALVEFSRKLFTSVDPAEARGMDTELLRSILADANDRVSDELGKYPEAVGDMHNMIGYAYLQVGLYEEAEENFRRAMTIADDALGEQSDAALNARRNLSAVLAETHRFAEAEEILAPLAEAMRQVYGDEHADTMSVLGNLAYLYQQSGRVGEAREILEPLLEARVRVLGEKHEDTTFTKNNLAIVLLRNKEFERSLELLTEVYELQLETIGEEHPRTLATANNLADIYEDLGDDDRAIEMLRRVLEIKRRILEPGHPGFVVTLHNLGSVLIDTGAYDEAEPLFVEAVATAREAYGDQHLRTAGALNGYSLLLQQTERLDEADTAISEAIKIFRSVAGPSHPNLLILRSNRARLLVDRELAADAEREASEILEPAVAAFGPLHSMTLGIIRTRALALADLGRTDEAIATLETTIADLTAADPDDEEQLGKLNDVLAKVRGGG